jgi:hypothetical protein
VTGKPPELRYNPAPGQVVVVEAEVYGVQAKTCGALGMGLAGTWWQARRDGAAATSSHSATREEEVWVPAPRRTVRRTVRRRDAVSLQPALDRELASRRWLLAPR